MAVFACYEQLETLIKLVTSPHGSGSMDQRCGQIQKILQNFPGTLREFDWIINVIVPKLHVEKAERGGGLSGRFHRILQMIGWKSVLTLRRL